jgi:uroporphyrinogen decarboxylase
MMTPRERMLRAIEFTGPDKIPVVYHPSPAGLHIHGEKLLKLFNAYPPDNPITFTSIPTPPAGTIDETGRYHEIQIDAWGTGWEFLIYGIQGHPKTYPFESWEAAVDYQFPPGFALDREQITQQKETFLIFTGGISIFERLHALRPIDQVLMAIADQNPAFLRFLDRLVAYWLEVIREMLDAGADVIMFGDDWGTQNAPFISPRLFKALFKTHYQALMAPIHCAGKKVFFHSCGYLGGVFDDLVDLGISGLWPQIKLLENNPHLLEKCRQHKIAIYIHPDRQYLVPRGSPEEIETAIQQYAERYHAQKGGGIFYVEIENDAPFENVKTLIEAIHKWR